VGRFRKWTFGFFADFYEVYSARNKKHGPLFRTWMGSIPAIHVMKPDHIEVGQPKIFFYFLFNSKTNRSILFKQILLERGSFLLCFALRFIIV
jgi:hypothetical protein